MMETLNYALVFTNSKGKKALCKNNGTECSIEDKPFYVSKKNAEKGAKNILKSLKRNFDRITYWYERAKTDDSLHKLEKERYINEYKNALIIMDKGLDIVEVKISIEI